MKLLLNEDNLKIILENPNLDLYYDIKVLYNERVYMCNMYDLSKAYKLPDIIYKKVQNVITEYRHKLLGFKGGE